MSDETNSEVKVEAATEVETKPAAEFFDVFEEALSAPVEPVKAEEPEVKPEEPAQPEPSPEPACEHSFEYAGHKVEFSALGDCFIKKDGECLGFPAGVVKSEADAEDFIDQREAEKGE
jgi:hypothetical protein